ncbi:uncharacterized protein [Channa argus]|uniref:uncharacterized protein isoform X2 n=1 Tax=Channa argus TaxID=215402 RepID=UPI003520CC90
MMTLWGGKKSLLRVPLKPPLWLAEPIKSPVFACMPTSTHELALNLRSAFKTLKYPKTFLAARGETEIFLRPVFVQLAAKPHILTAGVQMADQEKQQITELDTPKPGGSRTGRAVALARLLHHECCGLLQLYIERETFLSDHTPDGGRIVSLSQDSDEPSTEEQVQLLHSALRHCLGLLHCLILKEEKEWGELEGDYETMRKNVRFRLEYLLHSTKDLVEGTTLDVTPDHMFNEEIDGAGGSFQLKMWTHRVLLELVHWADLAARTLHAFHIETEGTEDI